MEGCLTNPGIWVNTLQVGMDSLNTFNVFGKFLDDLCETSILPNLHG